ncbi:MAG TPA: AAA family ATPase [Gaiellaceae bacterium]|nr:AAA family ATPase [Gaiellaceae bacterium]
MASRDETQGRPRVRIVVLLSGASAEDLPPTLISRRDMVFREYATDGRTPIESADVVLHVTRSHAPIATEVAALQRQTEAPIVLGLVGPREGLVDEALEAALADVLILPQPPDVIAFALHKAVRSRSSAQAQSCRVITVSSTKGGTGKTSIAVNVAVELASRGVRTLLVDLDVQFGDVGIVLGLDRPEKTLHDLAVGSALELDAEKLRGFVIRHSQTLHILPAPLRPEEADDIEASQIATVLQIARSLYDAIVVDTAPLFDGPMLAALDRSQELLLVSTPDVPAMKNIRLALQTLNMLGFPVDRVSLVANRAGMAGGASLDEISHTLGREIRFVLPDDPLVPTSINAGQPLVQLDPRSRFAKGVHEIVETLTMNGHGPQAKASGKKFRLLGAGR